MRIVQLGPYPPPHGGVQTNLVAIRDFARQKGHQCAVINITRHRKEERDEVYYPSGVPGLLWRLFAGKYDIVHLHLGGNLTMRLLALGIACSSVPFTRSVLTFHSGGYPSSPEGKTAKRRTLRGFVFRRFNRLIAVNAEILELFYKFGAAPARCRLIYPHAVAPPPPDTHYPDEIRDFTAVRRPLLITVGLLEPEYDLTLQVDLMEDVLSAYPEAGLMIVGSGSLEEPLRKHISSKAYAQHIRLCGDVPHAATLKATAEADLMLRTTLYDGDAVSVREALYLDTPVIATDNGMRPEGVILAPLNNRKALLDKILETLSIPRGERVPGARSLRNLEDVIDTYEELMS